MENTNGAKDIQHVFVYGTLRRQLDMPIEQLLKGQVTFVGEGYIKGELYLVNYYPGLVIADNNDKTVLGEVYELENVGKSLPILDHYEGYGANFPSPNEYIRQTIVVKMKDASLLNCWVYVYNWTIEESHKAIKNGDFLAFRLA